MSLMSTFFWITIIAIVLCVFAQCFRSFASVFVIVVVVFTIKQREYLFFPFVCFMTRKGEIRLVSLLIGKSVSFCFCFLFFVHFEYRFLFLFSFVFISGAFLYELLCLASISYNWKCNLFEGCRQAQNVPVFKKKDLLQ